MTYIYSTYHGNERFVNNNEELVLLSYGGRNNIVIDIDANFVASIIDIFLSYEYIILRIITNNIYYYDIEKKNLNFLINSFVIEITCDYNYESRYINSEDHKEIITVRTYYILIASDTKNMLFKDFKLLKEFVMAPDDHIVNFFSVGGGSEKTFMLNNDLNIIAILNKPYKSIVKASGNYCYLHADGSIDTYNAEWMFVQTITFKKMISIHKHYYVLASVDEENNYYQIFFSDNTDTKIMPLNLVCSVNNFHIFTLDGKKYLSTLRYDYCTIIIFDKVIIVTNNWTNPVICCSCDFNNIELFKLVDINSDGVMCRHIIMINNSPTNIITNICEHEIKLRKTNRVKSAKKICP
jgi:hypothetical protein